MSLDFVTGALSWPGSVDWLVLIVIDTFRMLYGKLTDDPPPYMARRKRSFVSLQLNGFTLSTRLSDLIYFNDNLMVWLDHSETKFPTEMSDVQCWSVGKEERPCDIYYIYINIYIYIIYIPLYVIGFIIWLAVYLKPQLPWIFPFKFSIFSSICFKVIII